MFVVHWSLPNQLADGQFDVIQIQLAMLQLVQIHKRSASDDNNNALENVCVVLTPTVAQTTTNISSCYLQPQQR